MPRPYGKFELQRIVDETHRLAQLNRADPPKIDDVLAAVGIDHQENVPFDASKPRTWHITNSTEATE